MARFVILQHDHPTLHWDLMLEHGPVLKTWRLSRFPSPGEVIDALALAGHRLAYLDYEGPVSGNRGQVVRRDQGTYEGDLTDEVLALTFHGDTVKGRALLEHLAGDSWTFRLQKE